MSKHFYKDIWFWLFAVVLVVAIGAASFFYVSTKPNSIAQKANTEIKLGDSKFGNNGTSYEEAKKMLGTPNKEKLPDSSDIESSKDFKLPVESTIVWEDKDTDRAVLIQFASKSGNKSDMKAVAIMDMNQNYATKKGYVD